MSNFKYFHFPIKLMQGVLTRTIENRKEFLTNLLYWQLYKRSIDMDCPDLDGFVEASHEFNVNLIGSIEWKQELGFELFERYASAKVFTGIHRGVYWDFYENEKTNHDWECLFAHLALKSILGKKKFVKSNNKMLFARMAGKETQKEYENIKGFKWTEYHRNKVIESLQLDWHLKYYSRYTRGFYFSYEMKLDNLIYHAEESKKSTKRKELRAKRDQALQNYLNRKK